MNVVGYLAPAFEGSRFQSTFASAFSACYLGATFLVLGALTLGERPSRPEVEVRTIVRSCALSAALLALMVGAVPVSFESPGRLFATMAVSMFALGTLAAALQNSTFRFASSISPDGALTQAAMSGQAAAGVLSSVLALCTGLFMPNSGGETVVLAYFALSAGVVLTMLWCFEAARRRGFHALLEGDKESEGAAADSGASGGEETSIELSRTQTGWAQAGDDEAIPEAELSRSRCAWLHGVAVFFCFLYTLAVFPGVTALIEAQSMPSGIFQSLLVLMFTLGDLAGRVWADKMPVAGPRSQIGLALARGALTPLFAGTAIRDGRFAPRFQGDWAPMAFSLLLGATNGHVATLAMVHGCANYSSTRMGLWMNGGLAAGGLASNVLAAMLTRPSR